MIKFLEIINGGEQTELPFCLMKMVERYKGNLYTKTDKYAIYFGNIEDAKGFTDDILIECGETSTFYTEEDDSQPYGRGPISYVVYVYR